MYLCMVWTHIWVCSLPSLSCLPRAAVVNVPQTARPAGVSTARRSEVVVSISDGILALQTNTCNPFQANAGTLSYLVHIAFVLYFYNNVLCIVVSFPPSLCLPVCLSVSLSTCLPVCLYVCQSLLECFCTTCRSKITSFGCSHVHMYMNQSCTGINNIMFWVFFCPLNFSNFPNSFTFVDLPSHR